ncbi:MAG: 2,3,4,5-tetrahydropyridine-2,6-dicarboxylate N-succinyltransferase, partial [Parvibaculum sp.]|nr:2,3,4,5-tetrahydropyridine-2,6-dicarboxylate N-succinyltransferase [Parvibaculum sp.]
MSFADLKPVIERAFENRNEINAQTKGEVRDAVNEALQALDSGKARVAEKFQG